MPPSVLALTTILLSVAMTLTMRFIALRYRILDRPDKARKIHTQAVPLLGGAAIFISFFVGLYFARDLILARGLVPLQLISFFAGACIVTAGGVLDDIYDFKPTRQIIFPITAVLAVMLGGISIVKITNPLGGLVYFGALASALLTFVWVLGMMYTTKLLDGVDGLVSGLGVIAGSIIFLFTMTTRYYQPDVGLMGLLFAAACLGFWFFNFYPAKIFLGESGSMLIGYVIAVLAIISGAKIAVALLIMGIPILDVAWTIVRRLWAGKNPFQAADKQHLHHRFLALGLSQRQTALVYYVLAGLFGGLALFLQSRGKIIAIGVLAAVMASIALLSVLLPSKSST